MKKLTTTERKWRVQVKQLLVALEQEINIASQIQSLKDLELSINQTEFQEQLKEIDSLLLSWILDLRFRESIYRL
ncbi:hypothetical protein LBMAG27_13130 [Bacteroidota bacterium]|nr:hypothetical protein LBMAG27_13130 [Bacteroidota bacterium]